MRSPRIAASARGRRVRAPAPTSGAQPACTSAELRFVAAEGIEQRELAAARHQRLVFVLAVDLDQQPGEFGELRERRRPAVDPGLRAAVGADGAAQLAGVVASSSSSCSRSQAGRFGRVDEGEHGDQFGALGAVADHAAVGARAGQEAERIDQQRLAGAGFAGNHGQAGAEIEFGGADDREILDGEVGEHGRD